MSREGSNKGGTKLEKKEDSQPENADFSRNNPLPPSSSSSSSSPLWGGIVRSSLYVLQHKVRLSLPVIRTFLKKKTFLYIGQRPAQMAAQAYPSPLASATAASSASTESSHHYRNQVWKASVSGRVVDVIRSSILGVAVFGIYEYLILRRKSAKWNEVSHIAQDNENNNNYDDDNDDSAAPHKLLVKCQTRRHEHDLKLVSMVSWDLDDDNAITTKIPLWMHIQAGALAGLIQSVVLDAWEIGEYYAVHHGDKTTTALHQHLKLHLNTELVLRRALHHSLGYATLFGCFEGLRQFMTQSTVTFLTKHPYTVSSLLSASNLGSGGGDGCRRTAMTTCLVYNITAAPLTITLVAGGMAGQAQYVVCHYLRQWRVGSLAKNKHGTATKNWKHVNWRPLMAAFLPTGLSFVAFQYAGELIEQFVTQQAFERIPKSQMFV